MSVSRQSATGIKTGCPIEAAIGAIGGVWKPLILFSLLEGTKRFGELSRQIPGATHRVLTLHLRELEADGLINRTIFAEVPARVEYQLTEIGHSLRPVLVALHSWGKAYLSETSL